MTFEELKKNEAVNTYIRSADSNLSALGFTEHSFAHVTLVAERAAYILKTLGYDKRTVELETNPVFVQIQSIQKSTHFDVSMGAFFAGSCKHLY